MINLLEIKRINEDNSREGYVVVAIRDNNDLTKEHFKIGYRKGSYVTLEDTKETIKIETNKCLVVQEL